MESGGLINISGGATVGEDPDLQSDTLGVVCVLENYAQHKGTMGARFEGRRLWALFFFCMFLGLFLYFSFSYMLVMHNESQTILGSFCMLAMALCFLNMYRERITKVETLCFFDDMVSVGMRNGKPVQLHPEDIQKIIVQRYWLNHVIQHKEYSWPKIILLCKDNRRYALLEMECPDTFLNPTGCLQQIPIVYRNYPISLFGLMMVLGCAHFFTDFFRGLFMG